MYYLADDLLYEKFESNIHALIGEEVGGNTSATSHSSLRGSNAAEAIQKARSPNHFGARDDARPHTIAIAVSGGSDSIALLMLADKWAKIHDIDLVILSVDHHLRDQSKLENDYIQELSHQLGHKHFLLHFDHQNNFSNLQARCREGRYTLMTSLCAQLGILTIMTGHHLDDYIENYSIRDERKSNIFGLSGSNIHWYNNVRIVRPLFNVPKKHLIAYLISRDIRWFEDESNSSDKYHRNRVRKKLASMEEETKNQIVNKQSEINKQVNETLKPQLISCIAEAIKIYPFGFAIVDVKMLNSFASEIQFMAISHTLIIISGKDRSSRSNPVKILIKLLQQEIVFTKTLNGCIIKRLGDNLIIYREFGRNPPPDISLNNTELWDNRFRFNLQDPQCYVSYLTKVDYQKIKNLLTAVVLQKQSLNHHKTILFTLPVIKKLEKVIAIPHISYYDNCSLSKRLQVSFSPSFISRFTHFC